MDVTDEVKLLNDLCERVRVVTVSRAAILEPWPRKLAAALNEVTPGEAYDHYTRPAGPWSESLPDHIRVAAGRGVSAGTLNWIVAHHLPPPLPKE